MATARLICLIPMTRLPVSRIALVTRGWDSNPEHQKRAIYAYYGGRYDMDPRKYYMKAVLKYAEVKSAPI